MPKKPAAKKKAVTIKSPNNKPVQPEEVAVIAKGIQPESIVHEMRTSYLDYAMSVIVSRALPDVRDGLKPVHRRILYAMWDIGLRPTAKFRKSATVVGEVLGKYHPHGDSAVYDSMVRLAQDFSMRYPLVRGQGNFGCFTKKTKVRLTDGRNLDFGQLMAEHDQGKKNFTFTVDQEGKIKIAEIQAPRLTRKKAELVEVVLDNNEKIQCTPNHLFMLRDGSYEEARNLQSGQSLMPVYIRLYEGADKNLLGYEEIYQPKNDIWNFIHHLADSFNIIERVYPPSRGRIRHHIDFNNQPELIAHAVCKNHQVIRVRPIKKRADVYDLTIADTHNFALASGIFVHNSVDGDNAAAMRYCVTGDTLVLTDRGLLPIENISSKEEAKINLQVLNYQGKRVKADKFFNSGKHPVIKMVTEQGYELRGSYNHPVLCFALNEFGFPTLKWKMLEEITKEDFVLINRNFSLFGKDNLTLKEYWPKLTAKQTKISLPVKMNKDLAFLLGALVSEGSFHNKQILFNNKDLAFYDRVKKIIEAQFKGVKLYEREIAGDCRELSIYHQQAVEFLKNIGLTNVRSDKKEIPFSVLLSNQESITFFLRSLFEGDGSVIHHQDKRNGGESIELVYNSKSHKLIAQLKTLLLNFKIVTTAPYQDKRNGCYKLILAGHKNILQFAQAIGFWSARKQEVLLKIKNINDARMSKTDFIPYLNHYLRANYKQSFVKTNNFDRYGHLEKNYAKLSGILRPQDKQLIDWLLENKFFFNKIKSIEKLESKENVYSLRVNNACHSFVANGFVNHNTEAKLAGISEELLGDIEKNTVDFIPNFDGSHKEPRVLPARLPNLLLNGSMGIAVGMATNIPPHNLRELAGAIEHLIDNPDATIEDLMEFVKGPDFPTGGVIYNKQDILQAYTTGKCGIVMRGRAEIEEDGNNHSIIITEIPYQVNKATLVEKIAMLVKEKKLEGIRDLRDESDKDGIRVVVELKKDSYPKKILNALYKKTQLQETFHVNLLALVNGIQPRVLNLKIALEEYIKHREEVIKRRTQFELDRAKARAHILEGLMIALKNIDAVIKTIKASKDKEAAKFNLMKKFKLSELQAQAIVEMKLGQLANLEQLKIEAEWKEKKKLISELEGILNSRAKVMKMIRSDIKEVADKYGDERKTRVIATGVKDFSVEDLVPNETTVVTMTRDGYIKRMSEDTFKVQGRGGKGVIGLTTKEEDTIEFMFSTMTHDDVLFFTTKGRVFQLKAYEIPQAQRTAKGSAIVNFLQLPSQEKITSILPLSKVQTSKFLFFATEKGLVKKVKIDAFANVRKSGLIAIKLKEEDKLIWTKPTSGSDQIQLVTGGGQSIRFKETDVRDMGRNAAGVFGIRLRKGDSVIGMGVIKTDKEKIKNYQILSIMTKGYGKRTPLDLYKVQGRGGSGIKTAKVTSKSGNLVNAFVVNKESMVDKDMIIISNHGQVIRLPFKAVNQLGRDTQGVKLMRFKADDDRVACVTWV